MAPHNDSSLLDTTMEPMTTATIDKHPLSSAFQRIPDELQIKILGYLTVQDLLKVTGVSHHWYNLVYEGSLWKIIDITPFYKKIPADQLLKLGLAAGSFLKVVNFRGCIQLTSHMLRVLSDRCVNVESLYLKDCRGISTPSIACFLQRATRLTLLDLSGLDSVKNSTLQIIGQHLPHLVILNISWCKNITGQGVQWLVANGGKCHSLEVLKLNGTALMDEATMAVLGTHTPNLRKLSMASCSNLTDAAFARFLLRPMSHMTHLNVSNCSRLSDRSLKQLALHGGAQLTHLELAGCDTMTDAGFTYMAPRLRSLVHLDLEDIIQITNLTVKALANHQPNLRRLCLSNCTQIDDDAVQFLILHGICKQLEHLELDGCAITDRCLDTIATFLVDQYHERKLEQKRRYSHLLHSSIDSGFTSNFDSMASSPTSTRLSSSSSVTSSPVSATFTPSSSTDIISNRALDASTFCEYTTNDDGQKQHDLSYDTEHRTLMLETLDCGNISESGVRSALTKADPFLVIKSFYSWMDTQRHDDQDDNTSNTHGESTFQHQRRHHPDARQLSAGRFRPRTNRHLTAGQSHSSGCVIL